jgi:hypothetical protein
LSATFGYKIAAGNTVALHLRATLHARRFAAPQRERKMIRILMVAMLCATASLAAAEERGGMNDAKKHEYFGKMKDVKLQGMRERIALMQESASCVQSAQNPDAMRSCEQRERAAMEQHQHKMKERWESAKPR